MMLLLSGIVIGTLIQLALCLPADTEVENREVADDDRLDAVEESLDTNTNDNAVLDSPHLKRDIASCPADFQRTAHGYCFKVVREKRTWEMAALRCTTFNTKAHLAIIGSTVEQHDMQAIIPHDRATTESCWLNSFAENSFWIGAQRIEPSWNSPFVWRALKPDGTEDYIRSMRYTNWYRGEPTGGKESCGATHSQTNIGYEWNDLPCDLPSCSICEIEMA